MVQPTGKIAWQFPTVSVFSREAEPVRYICVCVCVNYEIYFKELVHTIVEAGKSEIRRQATRLKTQGGFLLLLRQNSYISRKPQFLFLRPSND